MRGETRAIAEEALAFAIARESLKHPKHSDILLPLRKRLERILRRRWNRQQRLFLAEARHWLGRLAAGHHESRPPIQRNIGTQGMEPTVRRAGASVSSVHEADAELKARLQASVTAKINAGTALSQPPGRADTDAYEAAVEAAADGAIGNLAVELGIDAAKTAGQDFARTYLQKKSFHQLAADIDAATRDRMANAVADTFASGGSLNDAVSAIKDAFSSMKESRAVTIAQTELADVYNQAMLSSAKETGDELLKTWNLDGEGCAEICQPNAEDGAIGLDEDFSSGDDAPPAHPNCDCSIGFVRSSEA